MNGAMLQSLDLSPKSLACELRGAFWLGWLAWSAQHELFMHQVMRPGSIGVPM